MRGLPWDLRAVVVVVSLIGAYGTWNTLTSFFDDYFKVDGSAFALFIAWGLAERSNGWRKFLAVVVGIAWVISLLVAATAPLLYIFPDMNLNGEIFDYKAKDGWPFVVLSLGMLGVVGWLFWVLTRKSTRDLFQPANEESGEQTEPLRQQPNP